MGDATAGVYYRLSDHEEEVGEFLYLQTAERSHNVMCTGSRGGCQPPSPGRTALPGTLPAQEVPAVHVR